MDSQKSKITEWLKKKEHHYNHQTLSTDYKHYTDNSIIYVNTKKCAVYTNDIQKAIDIEKKYLTNQIKTKSIKITSIKHYVIADHIISCHYQIQYYEPMKPEIYQMLQKLTFKDVNMDALVADLYENHYDVNQLLTELYKNNKDMEKLMAYFGTIDVTTLLSMAQKHGITLKKMCEHPFVNEMIKQSPYSGWFVNFRDVKPQDVNVGNIKVTNKRLVRTMDNYCIFNTKDMTVLSINWNTLQ